MTTTLFSPSHLQDHPKTDIICCPGDFPANLEMTLDSGDYAGFETRRAEAKTRGRLRGIGISNTVEVAGGQPIEAAEIRFDPTGTLTLLMGTNDSVPGHATVPKRTITYKLALQP